MRATRTQASERPTDATAPSRPVFGNSWLVAAALALFATGELPGLSGGAWAQDDTATQASAETEVTLTVESYEAALKARAAALSESGAALGLGPSVGRRIAAVERDAVGRAIENLGDAFARQRQRLQEVATALETLDAGIETERLNAARQSLLDGDTASAADLLQEVVDGGGESAALASYQLGLLDEGRIALASAAQRYRHAATLAPDVPLYHMAAGRLAFELRSLRTALADFEAARALYESAGEAERSQLATALNNLAGVYWTMGRFADAEPAYQRALEITTDEAGPNDPAVAEALNNLADLYSTWNRPDEAAPLYRRALEIEEASYGAEDPRLAATLRALAALDFRAGRLNEADQGLTRAISILQGANGAEREDMALAIGDLAAVRHRAGRLRDADPLYHLALSLQRKVLGPEHPSVAALETKLAKLAFEEHRLRDAERLYRHALGQLESRFGSESPEAAEALHGLAEVLAERGRFREAERLAERALAAFRSGPAGRRASAAETTGLLASIAARFGRREEGLAMITLAGRTAAAVGADAVVGALLARGAHLLTEAGRAEDAEAGYRSAIETLQTSSPPDPAALAAAQSALAGLLMDQDRFEEALPLIEAARQSQEDGSAGAASADLARTLAAQARYLANAGQTEESLALYRRALEMLARVVDQTHPDLLRVAEQLAEALDAAGNTDQAESIRARLAQARSVAAPPQLYLSIDRGGLNRSLPQTLDTDLPRSTLEGGGAAGGDPAAGAATTTPADQEGSSAPDAPAVPVEPVEDAPEAPETEPETEPEAAGQDG